jgi:hypothetical protein
VLEFDLPFEKRVLGTILEDKVQRLGDKVFLFFEEQRVGGFRGRGRIVVERSGAD